MKDSPTINTQGGLHLFSMTGSTTGTVVAGFLFVLLMCVGYRLFRNYKVKTRDARVKKRIAKQREILVEMGWPKDQDETSKPCSNTLPSQQHSELTGRQRETVLKEWQTVVLPTLLRNDNGLGLTLQNISPQMPFLEHGHYGNSVPFTDYGQPGLHVPHAHRYYPSQHRSWSPSRFTEAEIHHPCLLYTSPSPRDLSTYRMPSSA